MKYTLKVKYYKDNNNDNDNDKYKTISLNTIYGEIYTMKIDNKTKVIDVKKYLYKNYDIQNIDLTYFDYRRSLSDDQIIYTIYSENIEILNFNIIHYENL